jgi:sulfite reductase (NADPH) flavoprotein alpha-component
VLKTVLFQFHWFLGTTAGLVLAIVGVTGGLLSFEDDIVAALNPGIVTVAARADSPLLTPQQIVDATRAADPAARITGLTVSSDPERSATVTLAAEGGQGRGRQVYVDPATAAPLGEPAGRSFFQGVRQLHRWMLLPGGGQGIGKQIVGYSTLALVFLSLSGLYLRWPRVSRWRVWFATNLKRRGRPLYWSLHAVAGVYVLLAYLVMAMTGLWWSFDWYKTGLSLALTGKAPIVQEGPGGSRGAEAPPPPAVSLDPAWTGFLAETGGSYATATITLPRKEGDPIQIRYLPPDAPHERASNQLKLDPATGAVVSADRYADQPFGERLYRSIFPLHSGAYFGIVGVVLWMMASLTMPLFFITGWLLYLGRRKTKRRLRTATAAAG